MTPTQTARRYVGDQIRRVRFRRAFQEFKAASRGGDRFPIAWGDRLPCLNEGTAGTEFDRHYVYHPAWAARVLRATRPEEHVDISSTLHFCTIVSAFLPVRFYDYRPAELALAGLASGRADLTALPFADGSIASLSCMHTVEHVGLGRYGDPLDPDGDLKAVGELRRVLAPGGSLLFVVPVGRPRILFNAHRIYAHAQITEYFADLELVRFALVPDDTRVGLIEDATPAQSDAQSYGLRVLLVQEAARAGGSTGGRCTRMMSSRTSRLRPGRRAATSARSSSRAG